MYVKPVLLTVCTQYIGDVNDPTSVLIHCNHIDGIYRVIHDSETLGTHSAVKIKGKFPMKTLSFPSVHHLCVCVWKKKIIMGVDKILGPNLVHACVLQVHQNSGFIFKVTAA